MLRLDDSWVWDFWTADDGELYHLFFLHAPRALGNPDDRHYNASIGHAVSTDLHTWRRLDDALTRGATLALVHARAGTSGPVLRQLGFALAGQQAVVAVPIRMPAHEPPPRVP